MGTTTEKAHKKALNKAIDYINANLKAPMDLDTLAEVSNISKYHFHRIFKAHIGESVRSYIARLRLEKAARQLHTTRMSMTDIALGAGYASQQSLHKAFKKHFGMAPSKFRSMPLYLPKAANGAPLRPRAPEPVIRDIGGFYVVYTRIMAKYGSSKVYDPAWQRLLRHAEGKGLLNDRTEYLGLGFDDPAITKEGRCRFYACIRTEHALKPEGEFGSLSIEGGKYAVFTHKGPYSGLNGLYQAIYLDWIPNGPLCLRQGMPFEKYLNSPDTTAQSDLVTEVYVPVR